MFIIENEISHWPVEANRIRLDPNAWARKYFAIASVSWNLFDELIIGINLIKLISSAAQIISQFVLDIIIIVLVVNVLKTRAWNLEYLCNIKIQWNWTT